MCFVRGAAATAALSAKVWNRKTNCLFRGFLSSAFDPWPTRRNSFFSSLGDLCVLCLCELCVTVPLYFPSLLDPPSAEHDVTIVKNRGLPRSHRALGAVKHNARAIFRERFHRCGSSFVFVPNFHVRANRLR